MPTKISQMPLASSVTTDDVVTGLVAGANARIAVATLLTCAHPPGTAQMAPGWLPVFGPGGASHGPGAVPDPGAVARPAIPYNLRSDGSWALPHGLRLGYLWAAGDESTASASFIALGTRFYTGFSFDEPTWLVIQHRCICYCSTAGFNAALLFAFDGVQDAASRSDCAAVAANAGFSHVATWVKQVAAGSHTFEVLYAATGGTTAHFLKRYCDFTLG